MDVGFYSSVSGMHAAEARQQLLASNLANSSTPGYKGDDVTDSSFQLTLQSLLQPGSGTFSDGHKLDLSQGGISQTGAPLDCALEGDGFFVLNGQNGPLYTRAGRFSRDATGELRSADNLAVQGSDGNPIIAPGASVGIDANGVVTSDGQRVGTLNVVTLDPNSLQRAGTATFTGTGATLAPASTRVMSSALENANVDTSSVMSAMMVLLRAFQASRQTLQLQNDSLGTAVSQVGVTH